MSETQSIRLLLTVSTLSHLSLDQIPHLISVFESTFSVALTDETTAIRDSLAKIDAHLFKSYTKPIADRLAATITAGIQSPKWAPTVPRGTDRDPSPYVYEALLDLVIVHTEVSTTAFPLTGRILKFLFEHISVCLINTFQSRQRYTLAHLMQATLDVEFLAQTLSTYTTDKAAEVQTEIYQVLDQRTDNEARVKLQNELPSLRLILKRLREGTRSQFACFRRVKRGTVIGEGRPASRGISVVSRGRE